MKATLLGQFGSPSPTKSVGEELQETITKNASNFCTLDIYSAFTSKSAVRYFIEILSTQNKLSTTFNVGIDQGGTSIEALAELTESTYEANVIYTKSNFIFHPKIYHFENQDHAKVIVGSSNFTQKGLFENIEANISLELDKSLDHDKSFLDDLSKAIESLKDNTIPLDAALLQKLIDSGQVPTEAVVRQQFSKKALAGTRKRPLDIFPSIGRSNSLKRNPSGSSTIKKKAAIAGKHSHTKNKATPVGAREFWFQTGRMTGGSGNILDLSLRGMNNEIPGGVSLFGINASEINVAANDKSLLKTLSIKLDNVIYQGNDIVYPVSSISGETNGTPRLQIKGIANDGSKITGVVGKDGFKEKVMIFRKETEGRYEVELLDYAPNIDKVRKRSIRVDRPTARAKEFGVLKE
jgi:HKD family nuclease